MISLFQDHYKYEDARSMLQKACEQSVDGGHPGACYRLAMMLATGDRVPEDPSRYDIDFFCTHLGIHSFLLEHSISSAKAADWEIRSLVSMSFNTRRTRTLASPGSHKTSESSKTKQTNKKGNNNNSMTLLFAVTIHSQYMFFSSFLIAQLKLVFLVFFFVGFFPHFAWDKLERDRQTKAIDLIIFFELLTCCQHEPLPPREPSSSP